MSKVMEISVKDSTSLIEKLHGECGPLQEYRELTENGIQAVVRTGESGRVIWDVDWDLLQETGVQKLCCIDTGDGMTGEEIIEYLNKLASGRECRGLGDNFGVGAKVAALPRNKAGLEYWSWKKPGGGELARLCCEDNKYGAILFEDENAYVLDLTDEAMPDAIQDSGHGTKVVLFGNSQRENTMLPPASTNARWLVHYLNTRYLSFPPGVEVYVREGWDSIHPRRELPESPSDSPNFLRRIRGQLDYLNEHAEQSGQLILSEGSVEAIAHWWLLKDEPALDNMAGVINSRGHVAAVWGRDSQNSTREIYEINSHHQKLANFGITVGHKRVVIYIEPCEKQCYPNTARTMLIAKRQQLPWTEWETEFCKKMPPELRDYVDSIILKATKSDQDVREKLKDLLELYDLSRWIELRPWEKPETFDRTTEKFDGEIDFVEPIDFPHTDKPTKRGRRPGDDSVYDRRKFVRDPKGVDHRVRELEMDDVPTVVWVSIADETREEDDELEDKAALYSSPTRTITANADFCLIHQITDYLANVVAKDSGGKVSDNAREAINYQVRNLIATSLVEAVLTVESLSENQDTWDPRDKEQALSSVGLTTAILPKYYALQALKREVNRKHKARGATSEAEAATI